MLLKRDPPDPDLQVRVLGVVVVSDNAVDLWDGVLALIRRKQRHELRG
eukprot:CAMPEP_0176451410 /NCGR_PEP_ID=MMETSP0127-20121128/27821_1 /TAXON_ID=938130 /ORGANISM="Platyophrya macrostoma, Strain WH" /LENGTH=47 /DNA_ID= /DNA_START= /DNA_END= /DNA_ORIENTATION=